MTERHSTRLATNAAGHATAAAHTMTPYSHCSYLWTCLQQPFLLAMACYLHTLCACRPPPIESRRAGLRGGKPEEATHSSPDENRPSNDQSGAPEAGTDRPESDSNAESEHQAANGITNGAYDEPEDDRSEDSAMQDGEAQYQHEQVDQHGWGQAIASVPVYQRSFAVTEPSSHVPHANGNSTTPSFFT